MLRSILLLRATVVAASVSTAGAQDQNATGAMSVESVLGGRSANDLICRDISGLSSDEARGVLHYVQGFEDGRMNAGTTLGMSGGGGTGAATDMNQPDTQATGLSADTATSSTAADPAASGPEITGSTTGSGAAGAGGYREIVVEQITAECTASPDMRLADVIRQSTGGGAVAPQ